MRKLSANQENPIDNMIYKIVEPIAPFVYKKLGMTANMITACVYILGILCIYCIYIHQFAIASVLYFICHIGDCLDGYVARKYNHVSTFGDYFDHIGDILRNTLVCLSLYLINSNLFYTFLPYIIVMLFATKMHMLCQEFVYKKFDSYIILIVQNIFYFINHSNCHQYIQYTKYVGSGTYMVVICLILLYYAYAYSFKDTSFDQHGEKAV